MTEFPFRQQWLNKFMNFLGVPSKIIGDFLGYCKLKHTRRKLDKKDLRSYHWFYHNL